jgi:8-oxo-dGTP pyrophosphatase MutT (NUDIX family)
MPIKYSMSKNICNNCGKYGHLFHQCKLPITSYGIIVFRESVQREYLMIRRKDTFGYIDFVRGKYSINNVEQIQRMFNEMTTTEKKQILTEDFSTLWKMMWVDNNNFQNKSDEISSSKKYEILKNGIFICDKIVTLELLIKNSLTTWDESEWEFPKGRRNYQEKDVDCALREFEEETGYDKKTLCLVENVMPFEEIFIGSNHKSYKHKYYLAYMDGSLNLLDGYQKSEVSKIEWKSIDECLTSIRPYNLEKKKIIKNVDVILDEYNIY